MAFNSQGSSFGLVTPVDTEELLGHFASPVASTLSHQEVEALTRRLYSAVSTALPACLGQWAATVDPLASMGCAESFVEFRMSRHIVLGSQRVRGKAGVIIQVFRLRFSLANGGSHEGHYALVRCFEPTDGSNLYCGDA